jgi:hypothetical protein
MMADLRQLVRSYLGKNDRLADCMSPAVFSTLGLQFLPRGRDRV